MLTVTLPGQLPTTFPGRPTTSQSGNQYSATWQNVPTPATYTVMASDGSGKGESDSQSVPFGTCT
jgi:hypothetical protein